MEKTYSISKTFNSSVPRSRRVIECAESFGLGLDDKGFSLYDDLRITVKTGDLVYVTGQSGSGKSVLLRELAQQMSENYKIGDITEVPLEDRPLVEQIGESTDDAIRLLSAAGLNDAYLFLRSPKELSDGQLYRFRVARLMESGCDLWVADEFGAVLDRITAKLVAYNLQKQARRVGATVVIATTHTDLVEELGPDLYIEKHYQDRVKVIKGSETIEEKAA